MEADPNIQILIVDDQPTIRESIRISIRTIKDYKLEFCEASNGVEGITKLQAGFMPDAIISDIMMPEMDGYEFCQKVKESHLWCTIPFFFLTAKAGSTNREIGLKIGAVGYLEKPFDPRVLGASIQSQVLAYWQLRDKLSHSVNTILSVFSHEVGTALNNIIGFTDLIQESAELSPEHQLWLDNILSSAKRLEKLRRKSAFLMELQHTDFLHLELDNLPVLVETAIEISMFAAKEKNIQIVKNYEDVPAMAVHRIFMIEAIVAVLENAIQFNPIQGKVIIHIKREKDDIVFSIEDEGPGVPPDRLLEIFEPFVTVANVLNHHKGTGLSLAIAKRIVDLHAGVLTVEIRQADQLPTTNPGAEFKFCFPCLTRSAEK
ncbi:MAG: hybrid sensor histidine kinase/response regulator [SAR324 cluster bacterium]|nr:hybrid sensor histidine kinase/response regulator [SAR324 cluster bacterium]